MRPTELYLLLMPFSEIVGNDIFIICVYGIFCIMPADNFDYDDIKAVIHD